MRTDTPGSMRSLAIMYNEEQYRTWGELLHSVRTGEPAFEHVYGMPVFEFFATHPEVDKIFNEAMIGLMGQLADLVVGGYDFSPFATVVDVGGGYGTLLAAILRRNPASSGILFDQPHVVAAAADQLRQAGVDDRCRRVGGDFFEALPSGGDAYVLSQIIHDWDDDRCLTILQRCREVVPSHGKLLIVDFVLPEGNGPFVGKWVDLHMLVMASGRERTRAELTALLGAAGFAVTTVTPTVSGTGIVEAVPVE